MEGLFAKCQTTKLPSSTKEMFVIINFFVTIVSPFVTISPGEIQGYKINSVYQ